MFNEEFTAASKGAAAKSALLKKNPGGCFLLSMLAFFATGFEHSIANMTLLTLALINNGGNEAISMGGYWFNLIVVTLGNMIGAILFVALPYHFASKEK